MPRTVLWRTAGDPPGPLNRVVGDPPFFLGLTEPGIYEVDVGAGEWLTREIVPDEPEVTISEFAREFTIGIGNVVIDLTAVGPSPVGTTTYSLIGTPAGVSISGANLTIATGTAEDGTITVRRSDDTGLWDLVLTLTLVTASISVTADAAAVTVGADDPGTTEYSFDITGGDFDGETLTFTKAQLMAVADARGLPVIAPEVLLTTDADSDGELDPDDVAGLARPGLRVHPSGQSAPTITGQWHIDGVATGVTSSSFTDSDPEGDELTYVETDGATPSPSNVIPVAAAAATSIYNELGFGNSGSPSALTRTISGAIDSQPFDRKIIFEIMGDTNGVIDTCTIAGVTATSILARNTDGFSRITVFTATVPANTSGSIVFGRGSGSNLADVRYRWGWIPATATVETPVATGSGGQNTTLTVSQTVGNWSAVLVGSCHRGGTAGTQTWSAGVEDVRNHIQQASGTRTSFGIIPITVAGTQTIQVVTSGEIENRRDEAYSIELIPA